MLKGTQLLTLVALAGSLGNFAAPRTADARETAGGWVTSFDGTHLTLLNDPSIYFVPPVVDTAAVRNMRIAHLSFEVVGGRRMVTDLEVHIFDPSSSSSSSSSDSSSSN